jgi:hypothetical protein
MLDWRRVSEHRERGYSDVVGSGRTTTMLVNAIEYVTHVQVLVNYA